MSFTDWCLLLFATAFTAACLWAWEMLDRTDRDHWYQLHQKKGVPQGVPRTSGTPQKQRLTEKDVMGGGDSK